MTETSNGVSTIASAGMSLVHRCCFTSVEVRRSRPKLSAWIGMCMMPVATGL